MYSPPFFCILIILSLDMPITDWHVQRYSFKDIELISTPFYHNFLSCIYHDFIDFTHDC